MDSVSYQKKISDYFSAACVQMSLQLAKEVGILDILYSAEKPLTSTEIAETGTLKERYVREILGALAAAEVIQVDDSSSKYSIPDNHKTVLQIMSTFGKATYLMGQRMEKMKEILTKNGPAGVSFGEAVYNVLGDTRLLTQDTIIDKDILPHIPEIRCRLERGIRVVEYGCAKGIILLNLAARYPESTFVGGDISETSLAKARQTAAQRNLRNISFELYDLMDLPDTVDKMFDWVFIHDTLHDCPNPAKALKGIKRSLKENGTLSIIDFGMRGNLADNKGNIFWAQMYTLGSFFCVPGSLVQTEDAEAYGPCLGLEKTRDLIHDAGFVITKEESSKQTPALVHYICKSSENPK